MSLANAAVAVVLLATAGVAAAAPPTRTAVVFEVQAEQAPEFACFITSQSACSGDTCPGQFPLRRLTGAVQPVTLADDPVVVRGEYRFSRVNLSFGQLLETLRGRAATDTDLAFLALAREPSTSCDGEHGLCAPALAIPAGTAGFVRCARNDLPTNSRRVVFVKLAFHPDAIGAGMVQITLTGTTATVEFTKEVKAQYLVGQVLGGDYAASSRSEVGRTDRLQVVLHPRCSAHVVRLPPRAPTVDIEVAELVVDDKAHECALGSVSGNAFTMKIPFLDDGTSKALRITTRDDLSPTDTVGVLEASWLTPVPPRVIQLGYRTIELTWMPHCLMTPPPGPQRFPVLATILQEVKADNGDVIASPTCPSITLVAAGATCALSSYGETSDPCRYTCTADDKMPAFDLPSPLRLRRHVAKRGRVEVVGEWTDTASYAGQVLGSFIPRSERTLLVAFERSRWKNRGGDVLDAIEVVVGGTRQRIDLTDDPEAPWFEVSAPGLECADAVRVQIDGTREYPSGPVPTQAGVLSLDAPTTYRRERRFGFAIGAALGWPIRTRSYDPADRSELWRWPSRTEPMLNGAVTLESYVDRPFVGSIEGSLDYHLGRMSYRGVELPGDEVDRATFVWYHRFTAMAKATAWTTQKWHLGGGAGGGFGAPVWRRDQKLVEDYNGFVAFQAYARIRSPRSTTLWLEFTGDLRFGEQRFYYDTDFQGQPRTQVLRSFDLGGSVRLRFGAS